ncbi:MAG: hypothetical protein NTX91_00365 [candidate division SR1 bacterium]|nr:hypothetical protein [candidate division SR1 bacterium]
MPLVKFFGVPEITPEGACTKFKSMVRETIAAIPEMNLTIDEISVLLIPEVCFDNEIHIEATFNDRPERTPDVREKLAIAVTKVTAEFFKNAKLIEFWGNPFKKEQGFADFRR